jgi:hypothetical protein
MFLPGIEIYYEIFPHKILESRILKKSSILIVSSSGEAELNTIMGNGEVDFSKCLGRISRTIVTHV